MLPGFRFLFSAIILSMSILIFGLGAAALLRAAHEEFASNPTWRAPPEAVFAQQNETASPVLATLVVDAPPAELKKPETQVAAAPEAPAVIASLPAEPEQAAAAEPALASPIVAARSETLAESSPSSEPAPVQANPAPEASATETRIAAVDKIDAIEATPPPPANPLPPHPSKRAPRQGPKSTRLPPRSQRWRTRQLPSKCRRTPQAWRLTRAPPRSGCGPGAPGSGAD